MSVWKYICHNLLIFKSKIKNGIYMFKIIKTIMF